MDNMKIKNINNQELIFRYTKACFLITNYQSEIPTLFEVDKDLVVYESLSDLKEKCRYYLTHDEERKIIASNGQKKIRDYHNVRMRIKTMIELLTGDMT